MFFVPCITHKLIFCFSFCNVNRNRVKGPPRELDTGAGFFIEEDEKKKSEKIKVVHPEGKDKLKMCPDIFLFIYL